MPTIPVDRTKQKPCSRTGPVVFMFQPTVDPHVAPEQLQGATISGSGGVDGAWDDCDYLG
jgi:hypothetical protein